MRKVTCPSCGRPFSRWSLLFVTTVTPTRCPSCDSRLSVTGELTASTVALYVGGSIISTLLAPVLVVAWILKPLATLVVGLLVFGLLWLCWPAGKLRRVSDRDVSIARAVTVVGLLVFTLLVAVAGITDYF